jgi:hypothetical protein
MRSPVLRRIDIMRMNAHRSQRLNIQRRRAAAAEAALYVPREERMDDRSIVSSTKCVDPDFDDMS